MATITIPFGGGELALRKKPDEFHVLWPAAEELETIRIHPAVSEVSRVDGGVWKVRTVDADSLDPVMEYARWGTLAHHAYEIADGELPETFIPTDVLNLKPAPGVSSEKLHAALAARGLRPVRSPGGGVLSYRVTPSAGVNPLKAAVELVERPEIEYVEPDYLMVNQPFHTRPLSLDRLTDHWHLAPVAQDPRVLPGADVNVAGAWEHTYGVPEVVIAILDDGFDLTNPDLGEPRADPSDFVRTVATVPPGGELEPDDREPSAEQDRGDFHGTPCAGLAVGRMQSRVAGVAPGCAWMPVRFSIGGTSQNTLLGIFRYISARADVVSCSWGLQPSGYVRISQTVREVFAELVSTGGRRGKGLVICFAAGNHNLPTYLGAHENSRGLEYYGPDGKVLGRFFRNREIHSGWQEIDGVLVVGAVTSRHRKALYSNWGRHLTVVAPSDNWHPQGVRTRRSYQSINLTTTDNEAVGLGLRDVGLSEEELGAVTHDMGGTSGATPLVAGACGLMISANPALTAVEVKRLLCDSANRQITDVQLDVPDLHNNVGQDGRYDRATGHSPWFGYGKLDVTAAVRAALNHGG